MTKTIGKVSVNVFFVLHTCDSVIFNNLHVGEGIFYMIINGTFGTV